MDPETYRIHNTGTACDCDECKAVRTEELLRQQRIRVLGSPIPDHRLRRNVQARLGKGPMSTINLCDRCGSMVKSEAAGMVQYNPVRMTAEYARTKELCPACSGDLVEFFNVDPSTLDREKAYSSPWAPDKPAGIDVAGLSSDEAAKLFVRWLEDRRGGKELPSGSGEGY